MNVVTLALCLTLSQDVEAPVPTEEPVLQPESDAVAPPAPPPPTASSAPKTKGADEVTRLIQKLPSMRPEERSTALNALVKQFGQAESNPVLPGGEVELDRYLGLKPSKQAEVAARAFLTDLIAQDTTRLMSRTGFPFFLEARRIEKPEELRALWGKSLRSRRVDLLRLYSIEVLSAGEMEKKYGKPPQRLSGWNWRSPNTFLAIANLSGHATILLLRQAGAAWQVVGFHD